jgi:hypothetical protein
MRFRGNERDEALELRWSSVALQSVHGCNLHLGPGETHSRQSVRDLSTQIVEIERRLAADGNPRTMRRLADLVLDYLRMPTEHGAEHVGVDSPALVDEHVVESPLDVADARHRGPARARLAEDGDLVGDLVADQRHRVVVEVRQVHLGRALAGRDRAAPLVDRLNDPQVLAQMGARVVARDSVPATL